MTTTGTSRVGFCACSRSSASPPRRSGSAGSSRTMLGRNRERAGCRAHRCAPTRCQASRSRAACARPAGRSAPCPRSRARSLATRHPRPRPARQIDHADAPRSRPRPPLAGPSASAPDVCRERASLRDRRAGFTAGRDRAPSAARSDHARPRRGARPRRWVRAQRRAPRPRAAEDRRCAPETRVRALLAPALGSCAIGPCRVIRARAGRATALGLGAVLASSLASGRACRPRR
jgi:hypothetical protein